MRPSDFPRDPRFHTAGAPFFEDGEVHLRRYEHVKLAMVGENRPFSQDASYFIPPEARAAGNYHYNLDFVWLTERRRKDGSPGRYDALSSLLRSYFNRRAMENLNLHINRHIHALLRTIVEKETGRVDLASEFGYPLAIRTVTEMVGLPAELEGWLLGHLNENARETAVEQAAPAPQEVTDYFRQIVRVRQQEEPRGQLLDTLIAAWKGNEITERELFGTLWAMHSAGNDTAGTAIVNMFGLLAEFDLLGTTRDNLVNDRWLIGAREETLRFCPPFPAGPSQAVREVRLDGLMIPADSRVRLWFSAANRDGSVFAAPDRFDVTRSPNPHLAFGTGMHYCIGTELARIQMLAAVRLAVQALPELTPDSSEPFIRIAGLIDDVEQAPFVFNQRAAEKLLE